MKNIFIIIIFLLFNSKIIAQNQRELTFVLLIDRSVPIASISDGYFEINDTIKHTKVTVPFKYQVGKLILAKDSYESLMSIYRAYDSYIFFKHISPVVNNNKIQYKKHIPRGWLNETYTILNVYNYFDKESRSRYVMPKRGYAISLEIPGISEYIVMRKRL